MESEFKHSSLLYIIFKAICEDRPGNCYTIKKNAIWLAKLKSTIPYTVYSILTF